MDSFTIVVKEGCRWLDNSRWLSIVAGAATFEAGSSKERKFWWLWKWLVVALVVMGCWAMAMQTGSDSREEAATAAGLQSAVEERGK